MIEKFLPDYLLIPYPVYSDHEITPTDKFVYGLVYYYSKMRGEKCFASNKEFARILGTSGNKISGSITRLTQKGYIHVVYSSEEKYSREEITPLVVFDKKATPNSEGGYPRRGMGVPQTVKGDTPGGVHINNIINNIDNSTIDGEPSKGKSSKYSKKEVDDIIMLFRALDASVSKRLKRPPERKAAVRLLDRHNFQWWAGFIPKYKIQAYKDKFCPKAFTPWKMDERYSEVEAYISSLMMSDLQGKNKNKVAFV